jgi:predicted PurR-regulated permease PerM
VAARSERDAEADADDTRRVALLTLVVGVVVLMVGAATLALREGKVVVLLLFLAYTLAAAVRPGVERAVRAGIPRALAVAGHLVAVALVVVLLLWLFVPVALDQLQSAVAAAEAGGERGTLARLRDDAFAGLEREVNGLSDPEAALSTALETFRVFAGVAFTLATAVYWIAERDRLVGLVLVLVPHSKRPAVRDTWLLIDLKLGAVIRTKLLLVAITATILSVAFWLIGLPYFLVVGAFAGIVEIVPVIGPLLAGLAAVAVGLTVSWKVAAAAALVVYGLRVLQDYVINPRLFGRAVDLPPLAVLVAVSAVALLLGPVWVPLAIPLTAVFSTLLDVALRGEEPSEAQVPTVLARKDETVEKRRRRLWPARRKVARRPRSA